MRIFFGIVFLVLAPLGWIVAVTGFLRRRDSEELQRVGVRSIFGALLVIAIEWIGYIVGAILAVLY